MLEFIQQLNQRYQTVLTQAGNDANQAHYQHCIDQLLLAEAFLRKGQLLGSKPAQPLHIAIVGPTQAGKSSLANVLLGSALAGVSPLAGYTVHPHGYCNGVSSNDCLGLQRYFGRFQQLPAAQLSRDRLDAYSLTETSVLSTLMPTGVLWDTPDFDSIDSATYQEGVLRTIALADIIILVVSKEKYADQSVWEMMATLEALQQPTLICLNKLHEGSEALLIASLQEKWQQARSDAFPQIIPLYYHKATGLPEWPASQQQALMHLAHSVNHKKHSRHAQALLQRHWHQWLAPVVAEHHALSDWQRLVALGMEQALEHYQHDYLNHPRHYETFQQALAELLTLLEVPGLAGILGSTRKVLTWPVKQLLKLGKKKAHIADSSQELIVLNQIAEHLLIQLADQLMDKADQHQQRLWWKDLSGLLRRQRPALLQAFGSAAKHYHIGFSDEVEKTAQRLYHKLQEQPLVLNSLRATRVTTDAAAIALSLQLGGIGLSDLVFAPAMLTLTSLLAESALGSYLQKLEAELKRQQHDTVKQQLFTNGLAKQLLALPEQLPTLTHFNISTAQLQAAELQLTDKRHGLRIL